MRKASDNTLITMMVNYKCVGFFGKCIKHFSVTERSNAIDMLIERDWLTEDLRITSAGDEVIKRNMKKCQY